MVQDFPEALMAAEADALCGAPYGERSPERVNIRNGYRERAWDTRVGSIELAIPKLVDALVEGGGSGSRGMSAEQVALVPQCEECLASNDPLTSHPWRLAVGETLVGRSLFRHVEYFGGPGARRRWGKTGGLEQSSQTSLGFFGVSTPGNVALTFHSSPLNSAVTDSAPKPGARASRLV
jgi:hypothetical protein